MNTILHQVSLYLAHRRKMGYKLRGADTLLADFARYCATQAPKSPLTTALALQWAEQPGLLPATNLGRLSLVRGFARYCAAMDPKVEVPPSFLLQWRLLRRRAHIFTPEEIGVMLRKAAQLDISRSPLHPQTYVTLIGLLGCTGLRPGEAIRLRLTDFNDKAGTLRIGSSKSSPERTIPLHASCVRALLNYRTVRLKTFPSGDSLFVNVFGQPPKPTQVERVFRKIARGIESRGDRPFVRLYDLRHTFATRIIAQWSKRGDPIAHYLFLLVRYLGHRGFNSTWWYVSADPRSLRYAGNRFFKFHRSHAEPNL